MTSVVNDILGSADYFLLLIFRVGALIISSPIFGRVNIPNIAKIGLILSIGFLFFTIFPQTVPLEYTTLLGFVLVVASEVMLGIALAFITNVFFALTSFTAGHIIDMQMGYGIVNVYDVQNNTQAPVMGNILNIMLVLVFFAANGPLYLIEIIYYTVEEMPIGTLIISPNMSIVIAEVFMRAFKLGLMLAMPILASGLTLEIAFGMLMRSVPQIHMMVVGMPIKMFVGLTIYMVTLPIFGMFSERIFNEMFASLEMMFNVFAGGT